MEAWLMRPVYQGMCRYESLKDCTLRLSDIADMNDYIDMIEENTHRVRRAFQRDQN